MRWKVGDQVVASVPTAGNTSVDAEGRVSKLTASGREAHVDFTRSDGTVLTLSIPVGELRPRGQGER